MGQNRYPIMVNGSIIAKEGYHCAQGWGACGICCASDTLDEVPINTSDYVFDEEFDTIEGDIVLDNNTRLIPYASYYAHRGIADFSINNLDLSMNGITFLPGYYPAFEYFDRLIEEIRKFLNIRLELIADDMYVRGLYVAVFSAFELFLRDFILCGIFNDDDCYTRAMQHYNCSADQFKKEICNKINSVTFHNFKIVKVIFKSILNIDIPETGTLYKLLRKRNDIVHRYAYSKNNGMQRISVTREDVIRLINECTKFRDRLCKKI